MSESPPAAQCLSACIHVLIWIGGPIVACVPQWKVGPSRRISSAVLNDAVPVRGSPAPMTWIVVPGCGTDGFWPMLEMCGLLWSYQCDHSGRVFSINVAPGF